MLSLHLFRHHSEKCRLAGIVNLRFNGDPTVEHDQFAVYAAKTKVPQISFFSCLCTKTNFTLNMAESKIYGCEHYKRKCSLIVCDLSTINFRTFFSFDYAQQSSSYLSHYVFLLQTPCCNKVYICRVCHDDNENHELTRKNVIQVQCLTCKRVQKVGVMTFYKI